MKKKSQLKSIVKAVRKEAADRPATYGMLKAVEKKLEYKIDGTVKRSDARMSKIDARFNEVDARFNTLEAKIDDIRAEVHGMRLLAEEQRAENRIVIDGLRSLLDRDLSKGFQPEQPL